MTMNSAKTHPYETQYQPTESYAMPVASSSPVVSHQQVGVAGPVQNSKYIYIGSRHPVTLTYCPKCAKEHVATRTHTKITGTTWVCVVAGLAIFWPLAWLPLCLKPTKQTNHYCQNCGCKVGRVKPFQ